MRKQILFLHMCPPSLQIPSQAFYCSWTAGWLQRVLLALAQLIHCTGAPRGNPTWSSTCLARGLPTNAFVGREFQTSCWNHIPWCEEPILAHCHRSLSETQCPQAGAGASAFCLFPGHPGGSQCWDCTWLKLRTASKSVHGDFCPPPRGSD